MGLEAIAKAYARRIERGEITIEQVPQSLQEQVKFCYQNKFGKEGEVKCDQSC